MPEYIEMLREEARFCGDYVTLSKDDVLAMLDDYAALQAENDRLTEELRKVNAGETVSVRFDLSPAAKEGAVREQLMAMGWTPPGHLETMSREA